MLFGLFSMVEVSKAYAVEKELKGTNDIPAPSSGGRSIAHKEISKSGGRTSRPVLGFDAPTVSFVKITCARKVGRLAQEQCFSRSTIVTKAENKNTHHVRERLSIPRHYVQNTHIKKNG